MGGTSIVPANAVPSACRARPGTMYPTQRPVPRAGRKQLRTTSEESTCSTRGPARSPTDSNRSLQDPRHVILYFVAGFFRVGLIIGHLVRATLHWLKVNQSVAAHAHMALTASLRTAVPSLAGVSMDISRVLALVVPFSATLNEPAPIAYGPEQPALEALGREPGVAWYRPRTHATTSIVIRSGRDSRGGSGPGHRVE